MFSRFDNVTDRDGQADESTSCNRVIIPNCALHCIAWFRPAIPRARPVKFCAFCV